MMKEKNKKTNDNENNEELQQHALDMLDEIEDIQPYEIYDKNRIDTTNLWPGDALIQFGAFFRENKTIKVLC